MMAVIGCPVVNRAWILPLWKDHVEAAIPYGWEHYFIFVVPSWDTDTLDILSTWKNTKIILSDETERPDVRNWANTDSYYLMSALRNRILREVRTYKPDVYISLDSDILVQDLTFSLMKDTMDRFSANAVGGYTFLDPMDPTCSNIAMWQDPTMSSFRRIVGNGTCKVDVIMAIKMMDNLAYNVNYEHHTMGEDFGWSKAAKLAGVEIYMDGRSPAKHVMHREYLEIVDKRVGF